jgi:CelD/BcsL family acetyltransferase involved in cellulose biosynthesis
LGISERSLRTTIQSETEAVEVILRRELITDFARLEQLSAEWDLLWQADPDREIFQSFAWVRAWWRTFGNAVSLSCFAVFEGGRLIGMVPLVKDSGRLMFLGGKHADYGDILCEQGRTKEVVEAVLEKMLQVHGWKECCLRNLKVDGKLFKQLSKLPKRFRRRLQVIPSNPCHTLLLNENRDSLSGLLGKNHTKRRLKKLGKSGALTFRHIETKAETQQQLAEFFRHQKRRRALAGKGDTSPQFCTLQRNLIDELDPRELRFGVLELNGRPLAWHISFQIGGKLLFYQQTFDVDAWDYSPGEVLIHELLRYAQENRLREVDFGQGDEPFKNRFTTNTRQLYSLYVDPASIAGQLRRILRVSTIPPLGLRRWLENIAKSHAPTFRRFRSLRLWLTGALTRLGRQYRASFFGRIVRRKLKSIPRFLGSKPPQPRLYDLDQLLLGQRGVDAAESDLLVRKGGLGDLIDLSLEHPEIVVPSELATYKQRLKQGDRVYLLQREGQVLLVGWTTVRESGDFSRSKSGVADCPMMLFDECWVVAKVPDRDRCRKLVCELLKVAHGKELELAIFCPEDNADSPAKCVCRRV